MAFYKLLMKKNRSLKLLVNDAEKAVDLSANAYAISAARQSHPSSICLVGPGGLLPD